MKHAKILIREDADRCLEEMLKAVNDGFHSGRVTKTDLASWIFIFFASESLSREMKNIRASHFDQVAHLKGVIKQIEAAKKSDQSIEIERLLSPLKNSAKKSTPRKTKLTQETTRSDE